MFLLFLIQRCPVRCSFESDAVEVVSFSEACDTGNDPQPGTPGTQAPITDDNTVAQDQDGASTTKPERPHCRFT